MKFTLILLVLVVAAALPAAADQIDELIQQAQLAYQRGDQKQAITICEKALAMPAQWRQLFRIGKLLINCRQVPRGLEIINQAVARSPSYENHLALARIADKHRHFKLAITHYRNCLKLRPSSQLYHDLAVVYEECGQMATAMELRSHSVSLQLPAIRGREFKKPVVAKSKSRKQLQAFLIREFDKEMPPKEAHILGATLKVFGLIPDNSDIKKILLRLLTEQIGGFYNPETKKLYLIEENKRKSFWERLTGARRDDSEEMMVIAHEMTHALQDQYFDLQRLHKLVKNNDDRSVALDALVEGDATLAMLEYAHWPRKFTAADAPLLRLTFGVMNFLMPFVGDKELSRAPLVLQRLLLFPYIHGLFFCLYIKDNGSWQAIDTVFSFLPESSEHILHPRKYLQGEPVFDCRLPDSARFLGPDWRQLTINVAGEFFCQVLGEHYRVPGYRQAASGWGGDRYCIYENKQGKLALIWLTYWDTSQDATEFFNAYANILQSRYPQRWREQDSSLVMSTDGYTNYLSRDNRKVMIIQGVPDRSLALLQPRLRQVDFCKCQRK